MPKPHDPTRKAVRLDLTEREHRAARILAAADGLPISKWARAAVQADIARRRSELPASLRPPRARKPTPRNNSGDTVDTDDD